MSYTERLKLAEELVSLRKLAPSPDSKRLADMPPQLTERALAPSRVVRQEMIELYAEHYTKQQLIAELEFYRSDIGLSILKAQEKIQSETPERINRAMQEFSDASPRKGQGRLRGF